jgi:predicted protein tyrosine phosphatase
VTNVYAFSRKDAEGIHFLDTDYVISITDPHQKPAELRAKNILRLSFYDINEPIKTLDGKMFDPMTSDDADKIVEYIKTFPKNIANIYVHCEAGISRSAGVAAAIAKYLINDDERFFLSKVPNRHCYKLLLEKLNQSNISQRKS